MIIKKAELETVAVLPSQYPKLMLPEIALAGRSNVGKSSMINRVLNRKALARTSSTPGKTRTINFYCINEQVRLVDLPGYGYAKASKDEKVKWGKMIEDYLETRENLRIVFLVVDLRHEPSENDKMMMEWIRAYGLNFAIICTKSDKLTRNQVNKNLAVIKKSLMLSSEDVIIPFSSQTGDGKDRILSLINANISYQE